jgi:predicted nucleic acid-binding protein
VFVDTGGWVALAIEKDHLHARAAEFGAELARSRAPLVTTNYVLSEAYTRVLYEVGHAEAMLFDARIQELLKSRRLEVVWISPEVHAQALAIFRKYADQTFSVTDCASFVVARKRALREVFGFDQSFSTMGLILRPSL